jgi:hypothetical protein
MAASGKSASIQGALKDARFIFSSKAAAWNKITTTELKKIIF